MTTPLIHIGMPKCGSTWLQKHFFNHRHGYHRCYGPLESHIAFISPRPFNWVPPQNIGHEHTGQMVPVITSESLVGNPTTGGDNGETILYRLHKTLPQAKILIVIREQRAMLRSLYQLLVNWGCPYSVELLLGNKFTGRSPRFSPEFLCFDRIIHAYQNTFGKDKVLVLPMELFQQQATTFLESINDFCGIDQGRFPISADTDKRENPTRSLASLECKRFYNRFIARSSFNVNGFHSPDKIQGTANFNPLLPSRIKQWQEIRFKHRIDSLLGDYYARSNDNSQQLTGIDLRHLGYQTSS